MKYALVTGGSRGIGRAVCLQLARMGYPVLINYVSNQAAAQETLAQVQALGGTAELLPFDVADRQACNQALDAWKAAHPQDYVAVLVNNAGVRDDGLLLWMEPTQWQRVLDATLGGFYHVTQALIQAMLRKKWGRIVNMASVSGLSGLPGQTNYSAAKGGLIAATMALAKEVAKKGVTVNAVAPGFIRSDMTASLDEESLKKTIPAGRFGQPEEVAALVGFLASEEASYITGQCVGVTGGMM